MGNEYVIRRERLFVWCPPLIGSFIGGSTVIIMYYYCFVSVLKRELLKLQTLLLVSGGMVVKVGWYMY